MEIPIGISGRNETQYYLTKTKTLQSLQMLSRGGVLAEYSFFQATPLPNLICSPVDSSIHILRISAASMSPCFFEANISSSELIVTQFTLLYPRRPKKGNFCAYKFSDKKKPY